MTEQSRVWGTQGRAREGPEVCVVLGSVTCVGRENHFPTVRNSKSLYPAAAGQVWPPHQEISYWRAEQV